MKRTPNEESPTFSIASAVWFAEHKRYIKPNTADSYGDSLKPLNAFFGEKPINEIEIIHLRMYQDLRSGKVRAHSINRELGVLQQVLREHFEIQEGQVVSMNFDN